MNGNIIAFSCERIHYDRSLLVAHILAKRAMKSIEQRDKDRKWLDTINCNVSPSFIFITSVSQWKDDDGDDDGDVTAKNDRPTNEWNVSTDMCVCVCVHELSAYLYINTFLFASSYPWYLSFCCLIIHHRNMYTHWLLSYTVQYRISSRINNTPIFFFQLNHDRLTSTWKPLTCYVLVIRRGHFCCHEEFSPLENVSYSVS